MFLITFWLRPHPYIQSGLTLMSEFGNQINKLNNSIVLLF